MREIIDKVLGSGAERCEVFYLSSLQTGVQFENCRLKSISNTEETGVALRLVKDGRGGMATATTLGDIDALVLNALETAECGADARFPFAGAAPLADVATTDRRVEDLSVDEMIASAEGAIARLLDYEKEIVAESSTARNRQEIRVVTSEGLDASCASTQFEFAVGGRLVEGTNILDCWEYFGGTRFDVDHSLMVDRVIDKFRRGRKNVPISTGPTSVVLAPSAVADVMMTLHSAVNGSFVERKVSPICERLGDTIFDERVTIYDDGLMTGGFASALFDDEGVPMQTTPVVEAGVLKSFLTDLKSAEKLKHPRTGNGLRAKRLVLTKEIGKAPAPEITNWVMSGGERPYEEILSEVKDGVLVYSIMGILMSNLLAGDFAGNLALGYKIENGRITGRVKDAMIAGNVYKLLRENLVDLSKEVEQVGTLGGIGSHLFPYVHLSEVSVSAGG